MTIWLKLKCTLWPRQDPSLNLLKTESIIICYIMHISREKGNRRKKVLTDRCPSRDIRNDYCTFPAGEAQARTRILQHFTYGYRRGGGLHCSPAMLTRTGSVIAVNLRSSCTRIPQPAGAPSPPPITTRCLSALDWRIQVSSTISVLRCTINILMELIAKFMLRV